jgi:hypothetical protein
VPISKCIAAIKQFGVMTERGTENSAEGEDRHAHFGRFKIRLPRSRSLRIGLGLALCAGGIVGFLPIVGFWMLPLGVIVLATDIPAAHRLRLWFEAKWRAWRRKP